VATPRDTAREAALGRHNANRIAAAGDGLNSTGVAQVEEFAKNSNGAARALDAAVEAQLQPEEVIVARFTPDLDSRLYYVESRIVLTDRRLLCVEPRDGFAGQTGASGHAGAAVSP
jgi:hypothetical protein